MHPIYEMELNETLHFDDYEVIRVPGGWVYTRFHDNGASMTVSSVFVRFDNEFQK